jgi:hypothetical protein
MLATLAEKTTEFRILQRQPLRRKSAASISARRPSVLDPRLRGDAWILGRHDGTFALCFDSWEMASVSGSDLDLPSLNSLLHRLRHRQPRR